MSSRRSAALNRRPRSQLGLFLSTCELGATDGWGGKSFILNTDNSLVVILR